MPKNETLLKQLERIIKTMRAGGRKPLSIYVPWSQLQALRTELQAAHNDIDPARMTFFNIPVKISDPGTGLWVSCAVEDERK